MDFAAKILDVFVSQIFFFTGVSLGGFVTEFGVSSCAISLEGDMVVVGIPGCDEIVTLKPLSAEGAEADSGDPPDNSIRRESRVFGDAANKGKVYQVGEEDKT